MVEEIGLGVRIGNGGSLSDTVDLYSSNYGVIEGLYKEHFGLKDDININEYDFVDKGDCRELMARSLKEDKDYVSKFKSKKVSLSELVSDINETNDKLIGALLCQVYNEMSLQDYTNDVVYAMLNMFYYGMMNTVKDRDNLQYAVEAKIDMLMAMESSKRMEIAHAFRWEPSELVELRRLEKYVTEQVQSCSLSLNEIHNIKSKMKRLIKILDSTYYKYRIRASIKNECDIIKGIILRDLDYLKGQVVEYGEQISLFDIA